MRYLFKEPTEFENEMVEKYVKETYRLKIKISCYVLLILLVPYLCFGVLNKIADGLLISAGYIYYLLPFMFFTIFGWAMYVLRMRKVVKNFEKGNFLVCPVNIYDREKIIGERGIQLNAEGNFREARNKFYLKGKDKAGSSYTYRVSSVEYKKSEAQRSGLAIWWDDEEGFYGACDLVVGTVLMS